MGVLIADEPGPTHANPHPEGSRVTLRGCTAVNDVGGTVVVRAEESAIAVEVAKAFWDYEVGWRYHGRVVDEAAVGEIRRQATTGIDPHDYRRRYPEHPELAEAAERARAAFDPACVYFTEHDARGVVAERVPSDETDPASPDSCGMRVAV